MRLLYVITLHKAKCAAGHTLSLCTVVYTGMQTAVIYNDPYDTTETRKAENVRFISTLYLHICFVFYTIILLHYNFTVHMWSHDTTLSHVCMDIFS